MSMDDEVHARIPRELKRVLEDRKIPVSVIIRDALTKAVGMGDTIESLMETEEELFGQWADSFIRLYQFVNKKLSDRENLVMADVTRLEEVWKRTEQRMKTREQLMEEIPELKELSYEDCFDWMKLFKIIEKYPRTLQGRLGVVQIREAILYREVKAGNITGLQEARDKLRAEIDLRAQKIKEELNTWTDTPEYKQKWILKMEEATMSEDPQVRACAEEQLRKARKEIYLSEGDHGPGN